MTIFGQQKEQENINGNKLSPRTVPLVLSASYQKSVILSA